MILRWLRTGLEALSRVARAARAAEESRPSDAGKPVVDAPAWVRPLGRLRDGREPVVSDGYHERTRPDGTTYVHAASDMTYRRGPDEPQALPHGTRLFYTPAGVLALAAADGRVSISKDIGTGGYVKIWHAGNWATQYMHLAPRLVKDGEAVRAGQPVGYVGHNPTGYRFNHLHFEIIDPSGEKRDPEKVAGRNLADWKLLDMPYQGGGPLVAGVVLLALAKLGGLIA